MWQLYFKPRFIWLLRVKTVQLLFAIFLFALQSMQFALDVFSVNLFLLLHICNLGKVLYYTITKYHVVFVSYACCFSAATRNCSGKQPPNTSLPAALVISNNEYPIFSTQKSKKPYRHQISSQLFVVRQVKLCSRLLHRVLFFHYKNKRKSVQYRIKKISHFGFFTFYN